MHGLSKSCCHGNIKYQKRIHTLFRLSYKVDRSIDTPFPTKTAQNETKPFGVCCHRLLPTVCSLYRGVPLRNVPQFICNKRILLPVCIRILWIFLLVSLQDFPCLIRFVIIFQHINLLCNKNVPHSIMFH